MDSQVSTVMQRLLNDEIETGEPAPLFSRYARSAHPESAQRVLDFQQARRLGETDRILQDLDWGSIREYGDGITRLYKERNGADRVEQKPGMSPEDQQLLADQFVPVQKDPNEIADMRQRLVKLDQAMKPYGMSVFTDPRTSRIANLIAREAGPEGGFVQSKEQSELAHMPLHERALMPVRFGVEAAGGFVADLSYAGASVLERLGHTALDALTTGDAAAYYNPPTSWAQDKDGQWYHNGGKVGGAEWIAGLWNTMTGQLIDQATKEYSDVSASAQVHAAGLDRVATMVSTTLGSIIPFAAASGPFMASGANLALKGLGWLATGGRAAVNVERAVRITQVLTGAKASLGVKAGITGARAVGSSLGLGAYEAMANGNIEGYGAAFWHGATLAPVLMLLGALGRGAERTLNRTAKIPEAIARTLGGAMEGAGFVVAMPDTRQVVWDFVKDPNADTRRALYETMAANMIAMGMLKGAGGRTPGEAGLAAPGKVTEGKVAAQAKGAQGPAAARAAQTGGMQPESFQRFGELMRQSEALAGRDPETAKVALEQAREAGEEVKVQAAGLDRSSSEELQARRTAREQLHEAQVPEGTAREEKHYQALESLLRDEPGPGNRPEFAKREELAELRRAPNTPEKRQRIIQLLQESRQALARTGGEFSREVAEAELRKVDDATRQLEEQRAAGDVIDTLLRKTEPGEIRSARRQRGDPERERTMPVDPEQRFLESGPDPMESSKLRDLPPDLRQAILDAPNAQARRQAVLDWQPVREREVTESELEALGMEPAGGEPAIAEARSAPPAPQPGGGMPASFRMNPRLNVEGDAGVEPIRELDVIREMEGFEGDPVRVKMRGGVGIRGRRNTGGILGWYHLRGHLIRLHGDPGMRAVIAAHEWAHAMEGVMLTPNNWRDLPLDKAEAAALMRAAAQYYPGFEKLSRRMQRMEAWAEFWARWLLEDPHLRNETSPFFNKAMQWLADRPALLTQMQRIQSALGRWRDMGDEARSRSLLALHTDKESVQQMKARGVLKDTPVHKALVWVRDVWRGFAKQIIHDTLGMHRAEDEALAIAYGSKEAAEAAKQRGGIYADPARLLDVLRMTGPKRAERFLTEGTIDVAGNTNGEGLQAILRDIGPKRYADFWTWMMDEHQVELSRRGKKTNLQLEGHRNSAAKRLERNPDFLALSDRVRAWNDRLLSYGREAGLFSLADTDRITGVVRDEKGAILSRGYKYYMPFQRVLQDLHGRAKRKASTGAGLQRISGSAEHEIMDPVSSLGDLARTIITRSNEAQVMKALVTFGLYHPHVGGFVTEVARDRIPENHPMVKIAEAMTGHKHPDVQTMGKLLKELIEADGDLGGALTLWHQQEVPTGHRPVIAYRPHFTDAELRKLPGAGRREAHSMNGKLVWLEIDPEAFKRLKGLDVPQSVLDGLPEFWQGLLTRPASVVRAGATALSAPFVLGTNLAADAVSDFLYSTRATPLGPVQSVARIIGGAVDVWRDHPDAEVWRNLGGHSSTFLSGEVAAGRTPGVLLGTTPGVVAAVRRFTGAVADWGSGLEQGARLRQFQAARDQAIAEGKDTTEANLLGLEAGKKHTIDFTRGGAVARQWNQVTAFFKAPINGAERFFRVVTGKEGHDAQVRALGRAFVGLTVPSLVLWWMNKDEKWYQELTEQDRMRYWWFRIPGMDSPFRFPKREIGAIFGSFPEFFLDRMTAERPQDASEVTSQFLWSFLPSNWMPTVLAPVWEQIRNRSQATGRPIVPEWMEQSRLPKDQVQPYTRWYARMIGEAFNVSPLRVDRMVDSYTGGIVGTGADLATDLVTLGGLLSEEGPSATKIPVVGRAFVREPFRTSRSVEDLFEMQRELAQRRGSGELDPRGEQHRTIVQRATERISELRRQQRAGRLSRRQADEQSADVARQTLSTVSR